MEKIQKDHGEERLTRHGMSNKRWIQCVSRRMLKFRASGTEKYMPLISCHEEVGYEQLLTTLMRLLKDTEDVKVLEMDAVSEVHMSILVFDEPCDAKWFCSKHMYWAKEQEFEIRMHSISSHALVFFRWHNIEVNGIPASRLE